MELKQTLSEQLHHAHHKTSLSHAETERNIAQWYQIAYRTAPSPYWLADGFITDWQASFNDWLSSIRVPKLQLLDKNWRAYASQLHYIHYLGSRQAKLDSQAAEIDVQIARVMLLLADAEQQATDILSGRTKRRKGKQ
ncbi:MAG: hypothetical protein Cons2KO_00210 [Congregibacter sp.]